MSHPLAPVAHVQAHPPVHHDPAELDRRITAYAVDRLVGWALAAGVGYAAWQLLAPDNFWVAVGAFAGTAILLGLVNAALMSSGAPTAGQAVSGLRVVRLDGGKLGFGSALSRTTVLGLAGLPTLGIGLATLGWTAATDETGQRRGAHDRWAGSMVLDVRPRPVVVLEDEGPVHEIVNLTAMQLLPAPAIEPVPAPVRARSVPAPVRTPPPLASPAPAPAPTPAPAPYVPAPTPTPRHATPVAPPAATPAPAPTPRHAAPRPAATPTPTPQPAPQVQRPAQPAQPASPVQPAQAARQAAPPTNPTPPAQQAPPRQDVRGWRVEFDSGQSFVVEGLALVGRKPEARDGEPVRHVVPLRSGDMSLSKTHAQFQVAPDGTFVVMDRGSTNGSFIIRKGSSRQLEKGKPTTVLDGDEIRFGDRTMRVVREQ